jgi:CO/xanthine dehydrogenase FAD-binding subunit
VPPFAYHCPTSIEEAVAALALEGALPLAGGTDVVPLRAAGAIAPRHLVDVKRIPDLEGVEPAAPAIAVGAATTFADLAARHEPELAALVDGAGVVGAAQTRARATLGGNVCRSSPAGDTLCGLLVLGAEAELRGSAGSRRVPLHEFFTGPGRNVRAADELLIRVIVPRRPGGSAYARFTYRRWMDLAVVGVAAWVMLDEGVCTDAAVAIGAAGPTPRLVPAAGAALVGSALEPEAVAAACHAVVDAAEPIDDVRGTRAHRLRVLRPLTRDVVRAAAARARTR